MTVNHTSPLGYALVFGRFTVINPNAKHTPHAVYLLSDLLEAVQYGDTGDAVDLAEGVQTHGEQLVLAGYPRVLDDGTG